MSSVRARGRRVFLKHYVRQVRVSLSAFSALSVRCSEPRANGRLLYPSQLLYVCGCFEENMETVECSREIAASSFFILHSHLYVVSCTCVVHVHVRGLGHVFVCAWSPAAVQSHGRSQRIVFSFLVKNSPSTYGVNTHL